MPKVKKSKDREDRIQQAIASIQKGMNKKNAAKLFGIPRSTLQFRHSSFFKKSTCGPAPVLYLEEENILVKWIGDCSRKGFPKTHLDVCASVKEILDVKLPVILFVDGHKTHLTQHVSKLCSELQIILVALYPNATRILQPADVAAFRPIKNGWKREVLEWRRKHPHGILTKKEVAPLLENVLQKKDLTMTLKNGFRATGLHPWDPDAIDFSKCLGRSSTQEITDDAKNLYNEKAVQTEASLQESVFKFDKFCELVGEERLEIYKGRYLNVGETEIEAENILYKIWREFQPSSASSVPDMPEFETSIPDQQDIVNVPSSLSLSKQLQWPETPKQKGRRQTDRVPFVVSSLRWQEIAAEKTAKKQAEISAKEGRKRAREEKRKKKNRKTQKKESEYPLIARLPSVSTLFKVIIIELYSYQIKYVKKALSDIQISKK